MGLERKGTQFRIRVEPPDKFQKETIRTKDVGRKGGLQLITGRKKGKTVTSTQSIRVSTRDFKRVSGKLVAKTPRGRIQVRSLKRKRTGKVASAVKRYF